MTTVVADDLDWCGCGEPLDDVDDLMRAYLLWCDQQWPGGWGRRTLEWRMVAYIAEGLDWTEHGNTIHYSWLTDKGREALARMTIRLPSM